jgi:hypothetical protein
MLNAHPRCMLRLLRRLSGALKAPIEELEKQNYSVVDAILREVDRRLDCVTVKISKH